jgi:hypothetical protein
VGDRSSATPAGPFRWAAAPVTRITATQCDTAPLFAQAQHDGFAAQGVARTHREVRLLRDDALLIFDWVSGAPSEPFAVHWRPPVGVRAEHRDGALCLMDAAVDGVRAPVLATIVIPADWQAVTTTAPHSPGYGVCDEVVGFTCHPREAATTACCTLLLTGPIDATTVLTPLAETGAAAPAWRLQWGDLDCTVTPASFR